MLKMSNEEQYPMVELSAAVEEKRERFLKMLSTYGSCAVAYSGGVDSAVVAKAAYLALGEKAIAVTGASAALAEAELRQACELAEFIGIRHAIITTEELTNPGYVANAPDRCYHCKSELYDQLQVFAREHDLAVIVNGTNADDMHDYRPGLHAADESGVRSPLAECGLTKAELRQIAAAWQLPVADKPATPCLSSRIAFGQQVTPERLRMIEQAEQVLRNLGLRELRVRYHEGDMARIEVPIGQIPMLCDAEPRTLVVEELRRIGFKFITLDLAGFRSGGFVQLGPEEELRRFS
ncbi:MAG: ATP-dependent sacrificial sulfur transferase LarE [Planctomycetes bacterium]|nr:ATP-dependent sacrificial sulfur transferase LarE [Planctomycetota bacterium]